MARSLSRPALRPFLAGRCSGARGDLPGEHRGADGGRLQRGAASRLGLAADDEEAFGARLAQHLTLVATLDGSPVGFASLKGNDHIEMLYVHPAVAGQGIGAMLYDALEKLAGARDAKRLTADVSDTAEEFFRRRGFQPQRRNTVPIGGEWLANTTMEKTLANEEGRTR